MKNQYEFDGDVVRIVLNHGMTATISSIDFDKVNAFPNTWVASAKGSRGHIYVVGRLETAEKRQKFIFLHRLIVDAKKGTIVDHINNDTFNNTRENLRIVDMSGNMQNRRGATARSKTGIRGVCWSNEKGRWRATIKTPARQIHVGYFDDIHDAERAVIGARAQHMPYSHEALAAASAFSV